MEDYARSMLQYQEAVAAKEQENADLVQSCQSLSDGVERLQASSQQNLGEISTTHAELATLLQAKQ